jgi:hypothetical protein
VAQDKVVTTPAPGDTVVKSLDIFYTAPAELVDAVFYWHPWILRVTIVLSFANIPSAQTGGTTRRLLLACPSSGTASAQQH